MLIADERQSELVLRNATERVDIALMDENGNLVDATGLGLQIRNPCDFVLYADDFFNPPNPPTRIVHPSLGRYYFPIGQVVVPPNTMNPETGTLGEFAAVWTATGPAGAETETAVQGIEVVSTKMLLLVNELRFYLDKSFKDVETSLSQLCNLGYTDVQLVKCVRAGLETINAYQPYPTFCRVEEFPDRFRHVLIRAAVVAGTIAQYLFAVDTDVDNWSDQGNAFVIQHAAKIATVMNTLMQQLDKLIPLMKLHFVNSGSLHTEIGPNFRLNTLIQMAPAGAVFRNVAFIGL